MFWILAQNDESLSLEEYIQRRRRELELEALAKRHLGVDHFLAITAEDHYRELAALVRLIPGVDELPSWQEFQDEVLSRPDSIADDRDLEAYVEAAPYSVWRCHHAPDHFCI